MRARLRLALLLPLLGHACGGSPSGPAPTGPAPSPTPAFIRGVGLSPPGFPASYSRMPEFFAEVARWGHAAVLWNGAWRDDAVAGSDAGRVPNAATSVANAGALNGFAPVAVFGWRSGATLFVRVPGNATNDWSNADARRLYAQMAGSYAAAHRPALVFLGNENDLYYALDPAGYVSWLEAYHQAYAAVKAASPATLVGPVFQFEHMAGAGALTGFQKPYWEALTSHDLARVDVIGLTLYPFFGHQTPQQVPSDLLAPLFARVGSKPLAITETGWPATAPGRTLWSASPEAQVEFVNVLFRLVAGRDLRLASWLFLHPLPDDGSQEALLFGSISLRDPAGAPRPVYAPWQAR